MPTVFVTAFHPIRPGWESYWTWFDRLAETGIPILLFLDTRCSLPRSYPNVRVLPTPLAHAWDCASVVPPPHRTESKDTPEFLSLMALKLRYLAEACAYTEASHLAWIDFRVFHVIRDIPAVQAKLRSLAADPGSPAKILAPGCWAPCPEMDVFDRICWRFCGGFLLGAREAFPAAYARQQALITAHLPRVTWEVNYWALMDDVFEWYPADHTDTLLLNVPTPSTKDATA